MLSSALEMEGDSIFLLLRLYGNYSGRGPLAAQLDRSVSFIVVLLIFFC